MTGLALVLYIIAHLAGNLFIFAGPDTFNGYAKKLHDLGPLLRVAEYILLAIFVVHIWMTALVVVENIKARGGINNRYAIDKDTGRRSLATRLMPWTGSYLLLFVLWHLMDFTFIDHDGPRSFIGGQSFGLYGVVVNAFRDPVHSALYIIAMCFLGFHLAHGVESALQTFGVKDPRWAKTANKISQYFGLLIALGYSSIPVYVSLMSGKAHSCCFFCFH